MRLYFLIPILFLLGCQTAKTQSTAKNVLKKQQEHKVRSSQASSLSETDIKFQKEKEQVLAKKEEIQGGPGLATPSLDEKKIYADLLETYDRNDEIHFQKHLESLRSRHPQSTFMDEAFYLAGTQALANRSYGRALHYFDLILQKYPTSNRARAALYAKGATYRKMELPDFSKEVFQRLEKNYPGSPEALRAEADLRMLR